ncbi:MAG: hypothetical protein V4735_05920 [Pseudomonadota bacterium]
MSYNGLVVDVLDAHLEEAVAHFSSCSRNERKAVLKSVAKALDRVVRMTEAQKAALTPEQMQNVADDVGLWFAGEVVAGRAEQYKAAVQ